MYAPPQVSVAESPEEMLVGLIESEQDGEMLTAPFVETVAEHCTEPPAPVAVPVKTVLVAIAVEVAEPSSTGVTEPIPLSIENEVALVVVQESEEEPPVWIDVGFAESVQVGAGGGGYVQVTPDWLVAFGL